MDAAALFSQLGNLQKSENIPEKIATAVEEKEKGNKFFKEGNHPQARYHYHRALMYVKGLTGLVGENEKKVKEVILSCNNNLAAVHIKDGKWDRVISCCTRVLEIDSKNVKALFRRGKAYVETEKDLDKADADLNAAASIDPQDKLIQRELVVLKTKMKKQSQKQQKFYANMFDKISKDESLYKDSKKEETETTATVEEVKESN